MATSVWKKMGALRGIAILLVVLVHAVVNVRTVRVSPPWNAVPWGGFEASLLVLGTTVPVLSITAFMVASGLFMARFTATWPAAAHSARFIATRWIFWSLAGYAFRLTFERSYTLREAAASFPIDYGPFTAYWFLPTMILAALLSPALARWAERSPWTMLGTALAVSIAGLVYSAADVDLGVRLLPLDLPGFLLGVLLSKHTGPVLAFFARHRWAIGAAALAFLAAGISQSAYLWISTGHPDADAIPDHTVIRLYSAAAVAWFLVWEGQRASWAKPLEEIGSRSLALLLFSDFFQRVVQDLAWHAPAFLGGGAGAPPAWLGHPAFVLVYVAAGVAGPLGVVWAADRVVTRRWRQLLMG